jgi:type II secretory pathway component PulM
MNALLAWYRGREQREQQVLLAGAVALPLLLIVFGLLSLQQRVAAADMRVAQKRQDLAWLQTVVPQLLAQRQRFGGDNSRNESLVVTADRVARESGLSLSSTEPGGNGALRVRADKASFDSVALWLGQLTQRYGVSIENANIDATEADGVVNATLVLRGR